MEGDGKRNGTVVEDEILLAPSSRKQLVVRFLICRYDSYYIGKAKIFSTQKSSCYVSLQWSSSEWVVLFIFLNLSCSPMR
jgi:hypothetical protein